MPRPSLRRPAAPPRRLAALAVWAVAGLAVAHHPFVVPRLDGVAPCVDDAAVALRHEPRPGTAADATDALASSLGATLRATLTRHGVPFVEEDACRGVGRVRFEAELRWLDPAVYRGYPEDAHGVLVVLHVGSDDDVRFQSAASGLYDPAAHGADPEAHLVGVLGDGASALARAWWTANPPPAIGGPDRRPVWIGSALAALVAIAAGVTANRRRASYGRGSRSVRADRRGAPGRPAARSRPGRW